jgi:hypothetical protein
MPPKETKPVKEGLFLGKSGNVHRRDAEGTEREKRRLSRRSLWLWLWL